MLLHFSNSALIYWSRWHWNTSEYKCIRGYCRISTLKSCKNNSGKHLSGIIQVALILPWSRGLDQVTSHHLLQLCFPVILIEDTIPLSVVCWEPLPAFGFGSVFLHLVSQGRDPCSPLTCLKQLLCLHVLYEKLTSRGWFVCIARYFRPADSFYQAKGVRSWAKYHQIRRMRT